MRRLAIALPLALVLAAPAQAADQTVRATPQNTFSPASVTINVGESVTWVNDGGFHNVKFTDGFEQPADPAFSWSSNPKRTFTAAGNYRYFCEQHGSDGSGMFGRVIVADPNAPPGGEQPPPADTTAPSISGLRLVPSTFCNKKTRTCKRRGAEIEFTLSEDAKIAGRVIRRKDGRRVGSLSISANAGANQFDYSGKGLALGKYRLELTPTDAAGNKGSVRRANFTVATKRG